MVFNSFSFAVFFPVVLALYWIVRDRIRQNFLLLVASYFFYAAFDWRFLGLMIFTTLVDYWVGKRLVTIEDDHQRKRFFALSVTTNLGVLGIFKYTGFFSDSASRLLHTLGIASDLPTLHLLLPIGISFYTFHGISYTCDVYRRKLQPASSLLTFACFVSYFPQLVAGPIGRATIQLPQFERARTRPDRAQISQGLTLIFVGLVKKVAIADTMSPFVTSTFNSAGTATAGNLYFAAVAFALEIYGDFAGYTDIARGCSVLMGIELPLNFAQPYLSRSITEFWRRWHISLSSWLRDYLYIPLGGNRKGERRAYLNLVITMLLGGLWHGAAWTFVVWGAYHGLGLAGHRALTRDKPTTSEHDPIRWARDWWRIILTFHFVLIGWVLFRASTFSQASSYLAGLATARGGIHVDRNGLLLTLAALVAVVLLDLYQRGALSLAPTTGSYRVWRGAAIGAGLVALVLFSGSNPVRFIYFQF